MDVGLRLTEDFSQCSDPEWIEVVFLKSRFGESEESGPSGTMKPSSILCLRKFLQRDVQTLPRKPGWSEAPGRP